MRPAVLVPTIFGGAPSYAEKVLSMFSSSDVGAFWPLTADATDAGPNGFNGSATAVTFASAAGPKDAAAPLFDGSTSFVGIHSAGLASAFSGAEGSMMIWAKVSNTSTWAEAAIRTLFRIEVNSSNRVYIYKTSGPANRLWQAEYIAGGTADSAYQTVDVGTSGWFHVAFTWSKTNERTNGYFNGAAATLAGGTTLGVWAGSLNSALCSIGSGTTIPGECWPGYLMYALWLKREASQAEIQAVYNA